MMWSGYGGWGAGDWLAMSFMTIVFWGLIVALVVWLVRRTRTDRSVTTGQDGASADEVLAVRFARGEIDQDEYTSRQAALRAQSRS